MSSRPQFNCPHCGDGPIHAKRDYIDCPRCHATIRMPGVGDEPKTVQSQSQLTPDHSRVDVARNVRLLSEQAMNRFPNILWLGIGAMATLVFTWNFAISGDDPGRRNVFLWALPGVLVASAFLMLSNPKDLGKGGRHLIFALFFCAMMWPAILLAMLVSRPWNDPKWVNRMKPPTLSTMKFWQLVSVFRECPDILEKTLRETGWSHWLRTYHKFTELVEEQRREELDQLVPEDLVIKALRRHSLPLYVLGKYLRVQHVGIGDKKITMLQAYQEVGGDKLEDVLEKGLVEI